MSRPKVLLLDGDGVIWIDSTPIPGAIESLNKIHDMGVRLVLVTNNSTKTRAQYLQFMHKLGLDRFSVDDIFSSGFATAHYLRKNGINTVYVSGSNALVEELTQFGIKATTLSTHKVEDPVQAIVVAKSNNFCFNDLSMAIYLSKTYGCKLIGTNMDPNFPMSHGVLVCGSGAIIATFETALDQKAVMIGKPNEPMFDTVLTSLGVSKDEVIMVGDRIITDINFASSQGARSILVLSGIDTMEDVQNALEHEKPTYVFPSLVQVAEFFENM